MQRKNKLFICSQNQNWQIFSANEYTTSIFYKTLNFLAFFNNKKFAKNI